MITYTYTALLSIEILKSIASIHVAFEEWA